MKKYSKYDLVTRDHNLTELMVIKNGKRSGIGKPYSVYTVLSETLRPYGINLWGSWTGLEGWELRGCILDKNFPEDNFPILQQMYGFNNADIYVCLERTDACEYGFYFNTESLRIKLVEYRWREIKKSSAYTSFTEFWAERKDYKRKYEKMLTN